MARCPTCTHRVYFWHKYAGFCSKECLTEATSTCPVCGKVGLFTHNALGCCSQECRCWSIAGRLGYDRDALLTPAWEKIVYHVRLPSSSPEISSLELNELHYERALNTILVVAAPPWMLRSKVLAELPYNRFDNDSWHGLWADSGLNDDELWRFHRQCYEDDLVCQKVGEHVCGKLRQSERADATGETMVTPALKSSVHAARQLAAPVTGSVDFAREIVTLFNERGYAVSDGPRADTLVLQRDARTAAAIYRYVTGMNDIDIVDAVLDLGAETGATTMYVVSTGFFTLQAEDLARTQPIQLIDGRELGDLAAARIERHTPKPESSQDGDTTVAHFAEVASIDGRVPATADTKKRPERTTRAKSRSQSSTAAALDAEIVG